MSIEVRQATLSDRDPIEAFLSSAYRGIRKGGERWTWQFVRNPFAERGDGFVPVWIAVDDGQVVGQIAVQETALQIERRVYHAGWIVDVMILPSHRGHGLGHRLHQGIPAKIPLVITLTMAPATRRIAERAGCITLADVRQFSRWVWIDAPAVRRYLEAKTAGRPSLSWYVHFLCRWMHFHHVISLAANSFVRLADAFRRNKGPSCHVEIDTISRFGDEIDQLWERVRYEYPLIVPRTSQFLNWRFVDGPATTYHRFVARRDGRAAGYVVLRRREPFELPEGVVVDIFASRHDSEMIRELIRHSLRYFGRSVAVVDCAASVPEFEAVFRKCGFFVTRRHRPTCVSHDGELLNRVSMFKNQGFFSKADHDWDQVYQPL